MDHRAVQAVQTWVASYQVVGLLNPTSSSVVPTCEEAVEVQTLEDKKVVVLEVDSLADGV